MRQKKVLPIVTVTSLKRSSVWTAGEIKPIVLPVWALLLMTHLSGTFTAQQKGDCKALFLFLKYYTRISWKRLAAQMNCWQTQTNCSHQSEARLLMNTTYKLCRSESNHTHSVCFGLSQAAGRKDKCLEEGWVCRPEVLSDSHNNNSFCVFACHLL